MMLLLLVINCLGYDFHPRFQKGTTFHYRNKETEKNSKILVSANSLNIGKKIFEFEEPIYEYYLLSFYLGRLIGSTDNGNLFVDNQENSIDYKLSDKEFFLIEVYSISYESAALTDFFLDYIPGGFFRVRKYRKKSIVKVANYEELIKLDAESIISPNDNLSDSMGD